MTTHRENQISPATESSGGARARMSVNKNPASEVRRLLVAAATGLLEGRPLWLDKLRGPLGGASEGNEASD